MTILLIEDDLIETMKMRRTVAKCEVAHELIFAREGEEAFEVLRSGAPYGTTTPSAILRKARSVM